MNNLRLIVMAGDVGLKTVRITFGNGQTMVTAISGPNAVIDFPGEARFVRSIAVDGRGFRRGGAKIEVLGQRSAPAWHAMR
jgi:hypothetical protein